MTGKSSCASLAPSLSNRSKVWSTTHAGRLAVAVDLVDHHDGLQALRQGLARDEACLRHRSFDRIDEQQHTVHHRQYPLNFAAEVGVAGRIDDVDARAAILDGAVLARMVMPRSRSMSLESMMRSPIRSWAAKVPDWFNRQSTSVVLPVVDVRDDGDVADRAIHGWLGRSACRRQARPAGPRCPRKGAQGSRFARWPPLFYGRRPRLPD